MTVQITEHELVQAFQRDWPQQAEITALRLVNEHQAQRITELEAASKGQDGAQV